MRSSATYNATEPNREDSKIERIVKEHPVDTVAAIGIDHIGRNGPRVHAEAEVVSCLDPCRGTDSIVGVNTSIPSGLGDLQVLFERAFEEERGWNPIIEFDSGQGTGVGS